MKVQYPGVADSIESDLSNLGRILTFSRLLPEGLFFDHALAVGQRELRWEVDYVREVLILWGGGGRG